LIEQSVRLSGLSQSANLFALQVAGEACPCLFTALSNPTFDLHHPMRLESPQSPLS